MIFEAFDFSLRFAGLEAGRTEMLAVQFAIA
jgi:hypothetical protein